MVAKDALSSPAASGWQPPAQDPILQRPSLGDEIYQRLVDDLISLRIPPGERLSIDGLARRFGVSQTPTRAALIRLEAEGLVVKKQYSGWSVGPLPTVEQFADIFELRSLIEPTSAARAARHALPEDLVELGTITEEMQALSAEDIGSHSARLVVLDSRFHAAIAKACGNEPHRGDARPAVQADAHLSPAVSFRRRPCCDRGAYRHSRRDLGARSGAGRGGDARPYRGGAREDRVARPRERLSGRAVPSALAADEDRPSLPSRLGTTRRAVRTR
ncbi:GntR family transcriptional regulator [Jiella pelagia]|uniref:GntR family transcriptional regulator n=1 Tax=Jiella pelagia TaxID=2986949 RepID=A0ABY7BU48_9HYPH|nr:GntR family transcriptional regulator [Jiella pelagia]WAP66924.1 GntR family transcriptional regulator [Jiella pelagia]